MLSTRILLIEDSPDVQALVKVICRLEGADLSVASTGEDGLATLQAGLMPDLIVLDIGLPGISGWDVLAAIKSDLAFTRCPVVMFSGYIDTDTRERAYELGATAFLAKPTGARDFVEGLRQYIG